MVSERWFRRSYGWGFEVSVIFYPTETFTISRDDGSKYSFTEPWSLNIAVILLHLSTGITFIGKTAEETK